MTNRLINEKSPYLLQHAQNPVDWYPWGEEAFEKARREERPIFLSIGYSTCYWCHVMEREVFENEAIAQQMNRLVVSIKVDREERPDVDRIYMAALQAMTGSGGWPMSMFLTPDLKPYFGATYIPPTDRSGRPGFPRILERMHEVWMTDRQQVQEAADQASEYLQRLSKPTGEKVDLDLATLDAGYAAFERSYDALNGGFGSAPKFPRPVAFNFLLRYYSRTKKTRALEMVLETLRRMASGGMHDHLGGGFHRYATDARWHVPHFEKMLYDQAQLALSYLEAYQITGEGYFADNVRDILAYVLRDMTHPDGGFYSAEDAESALDPTKPNEKEEGAFYCWTQEQIEELLTGEEARIIIRTFGVEKSGNVTADPLGVFRGKNILHVVHSPGEVAQHLGLSEEIAASSLREASKKLFRARESRPRPHLDDKILTSWNGLMISAFARAYQVLEDPRYLEAAERCASFLLSNLRDQASGGLLHRFRDGESRFDGSLEDYAFFVSALIDLYEADFDIRWLTEAVALTKIQNHLFYDEVDGGFFDTSGLDESILARTKDWYDGAEPSGNAMAVLNLLRLAQFMNDRDLEERARATLSHFSERILAAAQATPQMLVALDFSLSKPSQVIVAGGRANNDTKALLQAVHSKFLPNKILILADGARGQEALSQSNPFLGTLRKLDGRATAYVCENYACQLPTSDPAVVPSLLSSLHG